MAPLRRRTLAPKGRTPIHRHRAKHRQKVSMTAAISISPLRKQLGLYFQTWPEQYVDNQATALFLRNLLHHLRGEVIVVWDRGSMHKGEAIRELLQRFPRLSLESLPPYAPDMDPVEFLWKHLKWDELPNFCPSDVQQLDEVLNQKLEACKQTPQRLRQFIDCSGVPLQLPGESPALRT